GAVVGLMDADIYGPSIPIMMGVQGQPDVQQGKRIDPLHAHGISLMSMGFLLGDEAPVIWRGPMVTKLIQQFLGAVNWGPLDYLVIDLPPGTGDAQLTLTQSAPITGAVIVTTPQDVSLIDARKGLKMFQKVNVPVLGIVENMSVFACPNCGAETPIFRQGGGERTAGEMGVPFLGAIPIDPEVAVAGDEGVPIVARSPDSPSSIAFREVAGKVAAQLSIVHAGPVGLRPDFKLQWQ
ncbi:MAG: Mrp/NBP35 family ATP-binding protein, partial [Planctomycetota bacterium]|nr:Mrp/NBP35 family ATP-binding protein [Planctomycetota bacterium]